MEDNAKMFFRSTDKVGPLFLLLVQYLTFSCHISTDKGKSNGRSVGFLHIKAPRWCSAIQQGWSFISQAAQH